VIELINRISFLNKVHLFNGLNEEQLSGIAQSLTEREIPRGSIIFKRGDKPDGFYMVFKGKVAVTRPTDKGDEVLAWLVSGDYFGEEALFENRNRSATITSVDHCILLFLSRSEFEKLLKQYETLKPNFKVAIKSRKLARSKRFKWLGKNEVIYFIARRHKYRLYLALVAPVLTLFIPLFLFTWGALSGATTPHALGALILVGTISWGIWRIIDWGNDYYIVTNQRVIWLEKVIGLYDSRQEAPLSTILSVGIETDMIGRVLDYGNVIVRTFVGKLEFDYVDHPAQAADMIREFWERTKVFTTQTQKEVMNKTIRQKLGLPVERPPEVELAPLVPVDEEKIAKTPYWILALSNLFKLRQEEGGTIIYRKHWIVLIRNTWLPILLYLGTIALLTMRMQYLYESPDQAFLEPNAAGTLRPDTTSLLIPLLMLPILFMLWYRYTDWKNDIFMVTTDEILDIDRKPFGTEERRAAQIENILSTSYNREGIIAYVFNYGTVKISVGGTLLAFEDVIDPANVQADINRRRMIRMAKKNEASSAADRERFAAWIAAYHENRESFNSAIQDAENTKMSQNPENTKSNQELMVHNLEDNMNLDVDNIDGDSQNMPDGFGGE
jgi:CRP-like cAMP-binding protein